MRKSKTQEKFNRSTQSDSKCRMTRQQMKQYKISQLKIKFKRAIRQIREMKQQNQQDQTHLSQLMLKSQRIEKKARESQQKTKMMLADSLNRKTRMSLPLILKPKQNCFKQIHKKQTLDRSISVEVISHSQKQLAREENEAKQNKISLLSAIKSQKDDQTEEGQHKRQKIKIKNNKNKSGQSTLKKQSKQDRLQKNNSKIQTLQTKIRNNSIQALKKCKISGHSEQNFPTQRNKSRSKEKITPYICALIIAILIMLFQNK